MNNSIKLKTGDSYQKNTIQLRKTENGYEKTDGGKYWIKLDEKSDNRYFLYTTLNAEAPVPKGLYIKREVFINGTKMIKWKPNVRFYSKNEDEKNVMDKNKLLKTIPYRCFNSRL